MFFFFFKESSLGNPSAEEISVHKQNFWGCQLRIAVLHRVTGGWKQMNIELQPISNSSVKPVQWHTHSYNCTTSASIPGATLPNTAYVKSLHIVRKVGHRSSPELKNLDQWDVTLTAWLRDVLKPRIFSFWEKRDLQGGDLFWITAYGEGC